MMAVPCEGIVFWATAIKEQAESGLSVREYCRLIEKSTYQFYYWKRRVTDAQQTAVIPGGSNAQSFIELRASDIEISARRDYAEQVDIRIGLFSIRLTEHTDRALFKAAASILLEIVE